MEKVKNNKRIEWINQDHISKSVSPFGTFSFIQHLQSEESENYQTI